MATYRTSWAGGGTSGSGNRTLSVTTPTVGDLLVIICGASGNTNSAPTCADNQGGTYYLVGTALKNASADTLSVFVRQQFITTTSTHTVTVTTGANTAGEIVGIAYRSIPNVGQQAIRSSGFQANQAGGGTPAPALNISALTENPTITGCFNGTAGGSVLVPNASWVERQDVSQSTPTTGVEVATRDSGFTGTTITAGGTSATAFASFAIELDADLNFNESLGSQPTIKQDKSLWPPLVFTVGSLLVTTLAPIVPPIFSGASELTETLHHPARSYYLNSDTSSGSYPLVRPYNTETTRQPYYQGQKKWDKLFSETSQSSPRTLAVTIEIPPVVNNPQERSQQPYWYFGDTSTSTAKTLIEDAQVPVQNLQHSSPDRVRPVVDTTKAYLKTLYADQIPPLKNPQIFQPDKIRPVSDTTTGTSKTLTEDKQLPFFIEAHVAPDKVRPVTDTTRSTPKNLFEDAQTPFFIQPYTAPDKLRPVVDTTQKQPITLQVIIPSAPLVNVPQYVPVKYWYQPSDNSLGTAKVLYSDAQLPFANLQHSAPDKVVSVIPINYSNNLITIVIVQAPFNNPWIYTPEWCWQVQDTSRSTAKVLFFDSTKPFFNAPQYFVEQNLYRNEDESRSIAKTLYDDVVVPPTSCVVDYGVSVFGEGYGKGVSKLNYDANCTETCTVSEDEEGTVSHANWVHV